MAQSVSAFADEQQVYDDLWKRVEWCDSHMSNDATINVLDSLLAPSRKYPDITEAIYILHTTYYYQRRDIDGVRKAFNNARQWGMAHKSDYCVFLSWERYVMCYYFLERYDEYIAEIRRMKDEARRQKSVYGMVQSMVQEGNYFITYKNYQSACNSYREAADLARKHVGEPHINFIFPSTMLGNAYFQLHQYDESAKVLMEAISATDNFTRQMASRAYLYRTQVAQENLSDATLTREWFMKNAPRQRLLSGMRHVFDATEVGYFLLAGDTKTAREKLAYVTDEQQHLQLTHKVLALEGQWLASSDTLKRYRKLSDSLFNNQMRLSLQVYENDNQAYELSMKNAAMAQQISKLQFQRATSENERARLQAHQDELNMAETNRQAREAEWRQQAQDSLLKERQQRQLLRQESEKILAQSALWKKVVILGSLLAAIITFFIIFYNVVHLHLQRSKIRQATARIKQLDKMKSMFIQNMNHEIRSPLASIVSFSDLLSTSGLDVSEEERTLIRQQLHSNTELLLTLLDDVIDLSTLQSGNYQTNISSVPLSILCQTAVAGMAVHVHEGVELRTDLPEEETQIMSDHSRVFQVINNLLSNACKYTEAGHITLAYRRSGVNEVEISVTDTGCGIPASKADAVFHRFETLGTMKKGFGLGLFICRSVVELLGGSIWLDTTYTEGARFCFRLPVNPPQKGSKRTPRSHHAVFAMLTGLLFLFTPFHTKAQNNPQEIHDDLYPYYMVTSSMVRQAKGLAMTDTLERMAIQHSDLKAQCLAKVLRVQYYSAAGASVDSLLLLSNQLISFCRRTPYKQYCFAGLNEARVRALNANDFSKAKEIVDAYQRLAIELNYPYGLANLNVAKGDYYYQLSFANQALDYYKAAVEKFREYDEMKNSLTSFIRISSTLRLLGRYDEALETCQEAEKYCLVPSHFKQLLAEKLGIFIVQQNIDSIKATLRIIDQQYRSALSLREISKYYEALTVCALAEHNYDRALACTDSIFVPDYRRSALLAIYRSQGNYQQYYDLLLSVSNEKDSVDGARMAAISYSFISRYEVQQQQLLLEELEIEQRDMQTQASLEETRMLLLQHQRDSAEEARSEQLAQDLLRRTQLSKELQASIDQDIAEKETFMNAMRRRQDLRWMVIISASVAIFVISALLFLFGRRLKKSREAMLQAQHDAEMTDQLKNRFLQDLNHEIRTPLNAILGYTDVLQQADEFGLSAEEQRMMNDAVHTQSAHLFTLVNQVLDLSKLESGTYQFLSNPFSLKDLCQEALDAVRPNVAEGVELQLDVPEDAPVIHADKARLLQLLGHLLQNAASATSRGHILVRCQLYHQAKKHMLQLSVQDTGQGIPEEERERVFHRFYKCNQFAPGFGLGLPICQTIAQLLGGTIKLQSSPHGTTVTATIRIR